MNIKPTDAAFPAPMNASLGLSKREYFAGLAMQGIISNQYIMPRIPGNGNEEKWIAETAVQQADALIEALNKQP